MSKAKIISYDLDNPGQKYSDLIKRIKEYPDWAKLTESCWIVYSPNTSKEIRDELYKIIDNNDRLFVADLTGVSAWHNVMADDEAVKRILKS